MEDREITAFAPAGRASTAELQRQQAAVMEDEGLRTILDAMPDLVMVLNSARQIVYGNTALISFAKSQGCENYIGMRPGELLQCRYALSARCGCGTAEECRECGAVHSILAALDGNKSDAECRILRYTPTGPEGLDLHVWGTPFRWRGENLALVVAEDISHQKRRHALERIFFHDILNTAGTIDTMANMLLQGFLSFEDAKEDLRDTARHLVAEIRTQRELLAAENNELAVNVLTVQATEILETVIAQYRNADCGKGKDTIIDPQSQRVTLATDPALLVRVIGNLVKNALEASEPGETVVVSARQEGNAIVFRCSNRGHIPRAAQAHIFHRSFSTKGVGRGLGTYSVKLLTEKYLKGAVRFTSSPDAGTTFTVTLPHDLRQG